MVATGAAWLLMVQLAGAAPVLPVPADALRSLSATGHTLGQQAAGFHLQQPPFTFDATRFDSLTAITLRGLFEDAVEMGLPVRPLINRALEGSARRMTGDRIVRVVRDLAAALTDARTALGPGATTDELEAAADALRAGYDIAAIKAVRATRPTGSALTALVVLTDLARRGVPNTTARDAVTRLSRLPRADEALLNLQTAVARNSQRGPGMALEALNRYLRTTVPGSPEPPAPASIDRKPVQPPES